MTTFTKKPQSKPVTLDVVNKTIQQLKAQLHDLAHNAARNTELLQRPALMQQVQRQIDMLTVLAAKLAPKPAGGFFDINNAKGTQLKEIPIKGDNSNIENTP